MERIPIYDAVKIGSWDEVDSLSLSTITKNDSDTTKLSGIILKGYETKFNGMKNKNGEVYDPGCLDNFIENYFTKNKLNMPVDIQHRDDINHLCGRVLLLEVNSVGFYFVVYIPKTYKYYEQVKFLLSEGILQGFSKYGWATDYEYIYKPNGEYDYTIIRQMEIFTVSIVASPANPVSFEKIQEIKNGFKFENKLKPLKQEIEDEFDNMFN